MLVTLVPGEAWQKDEEFQDCPGHIARPTSINNKQIYKEQAASPDL